MQIPDVIRLEVGSEIFKLSIDGYLHLSFRVSELKGIQSWKEEKGLWTIEYYFDGFTILTEYDRRQRWEVILKILDNACLLQSDKQ